MPISSMDKPNDRDEELELLYCRALVVHEYFLENSKKKATPENMQPFEKKKVELMSLAKTSIDDAFYRRDLRGLCRHLKHLGSSLAR